MDDTATSAPSASWAGEELRSTLKFLAMPACIAAFPVVLGVQLPSIVLYGAAGIVGLILINRLMRDPEWLMAAAIIYLPLNMMFVVPIGPGLNATNILLILLLFAYYRYGRERDEPKLAPFATLVRAYMIMTLLSVVTAVITMGPGFIAERTLDVKGWLDQFIIFFVFLNLIRDANMARRMAVYMMLGSVVVAALGFQEWLEKRDYSSMEKSRLLGPQLQPNDFGAFVAYASAPFLALALNNWRRLKPLMVAVPYLFVSARLLIATYSRGAYLGMALAGIVASYVRSKTFLLAGILIGAAVVVTMPEVLPESVVARMSQTAAQPASDIGGEKLDNSSQTRLILWKAALTMTAYSPVFGWGFRTFPHFKGDFTETQVHESDNHNMYLYLSSQMGVPAVVLLLLIFWRLYSAGVFVFRRNTDPFTRVIGMSAAAMAAAAFLVNMFGSRMVDICVTVHIWIMLAIIANLRATTPATPAGEVSVDSRPRTWSDVRAEEERATGPA
ncbi:MAG TPA: O-antigen ligase family protein [Polyangiaceae bacterium]|nr:O-antigen ligase family protein [Polyangiaceae bacterium]